MRNSVLISWYGFFCGSTPFNKSGFRPKKWTEILLLIDMQFFFFSYLNEGFSSSIEASSSPETALSWHFPLFFKFVHLWTTVRYHKTSDRYLRLTLATLHCTVPYPVTSYELKNILVSGSGLAPLRRPPAPGAGAWETAGRNPGRAAALEVPHPAVGPGKGLIVQIFNYLYIREATWFSELIPLCLWAYFSGNFERAENEMGRSGEYRGLLCMSASHVHHSYLLDSQRPK